MKDFKCESHSLQAIDCCKVISSANFQVSYLLSHLNHILFNIAGAVSAFTLNNFSLMCTKNPYCIKYQGKTRE